VYWRLLLAGFRRQSAYRLAAFGGLVANLTFGLLKVAILFATVRAAGGELHGYDTESMSTYVWLSQGLLGSVNMTGRTDLALRVKDGRVAVDFLRPVDLQASTLATEAGGALFALLPRGLPSVLLGAVTVGIAMPGNPVFYLLGAVSLVLGIVISAATVYLIAVAGFWLIETRGVQIVYMLASGFLGGLYVPVVLLPQWLRIVAVATPFPATMMYPIDVLSGFGGATRAAGLVLAQIGWLAVVAAAGQFLTRAGRRRLEVQGGLARRPGRRCRPRGCTAGWATDCGPTAPFLPHGPARSAPTGPASRSTWAARCLSAWSNLPRSGSSSPTSPPSAGCTSTRSCWSSA
jgi:ABC-2 type transport system permease protein